MKVLSTFFLHKRKDKNQAGFTLIEIILSMAVFAILSGFIVVNLFRPQTQSVVNATVTTLVTELRQQQIKAMSGETEGAPSAQAFGLFIEPTSYTLFKGTSYNASDPSNFKVNLDANLALSTSFSSSQVIFSQLSGEVQSFVAGQNTITLTNTAGGEQKTVTINRYGVVDVL